jgi:DNA-binding NtrC family response regulator
MHSAASCCVSIAAEVVPELRGRILVIDDERGPREALRLIFERTYEVTAVESGEQALDRVRHAEFDLATLDLKMPGMSGLQTLAAIRELDPDLDVVVVTGFGSYDAAIETLRLQAFDFLTKPFDVGRVLETVARALERRRNRSRHERPTATQDLVEQIASEVGRLEHALGSRLVEADRRSIDRLRLFTVALRERLSGGEDDDLDRGDESRR